MSHSHFFYIQLNPFIRDTHQRAVSCISYEGSLISMVRCSCFLIYHYFDMGTLRLNWLWKKILQPVAKSTLCPNAWWFPWHTVPLGTYVMFSRCNFLTLLGYDSLSSPKQITFELQLAANSAAFGVKMFVIRKSVNQNLRIFYPFLLTVLGSVPVQKMSNQWERWGSYPCY